MSTLANGQLTFGDLLRQHRRAARLTQEQLAERTGLSARGISDLERGARQAPHSDTLRLLASALNLTLDQTRTLEAAVVRLRRKRSPGAGSLPAGRSAALLTHPVLPTPLTSFVGREAEVAAAVHLLRRGDVRLLTLLGPPGVGKTRLALRVAETVARDFPDGAAFVALSPITDPALVLPTIAHALNLADRGDHPPLERLVSALRERRMLLLLDNFEQVAAAGPQVVALLQACPGVVGLITSRAALSVQGEQQLPVPPLAVPEPEDMRPGNGEVVAGMVAQYPAVRLLIERAQALKPDFAPTSATLPALVAICRRLDGLPLAIELAAPRLKIVPPYTLLSRLDRLLPTLIDGARDLPERQQTMRATIAWSESLLTEPQRALFWRLAVFAGGWTLEAAEAVCQAPDRATRLDLNMLEGLGALIDRNLVQQREEEGGEPRFSMLHVIREYALDQLEASAEATAVRRAHARYLLAVAEEATSHLKAADVSVWQAQLERERDNWRGALGWACTHGETEIGLRLGAALGAFWYYRSDIREGRRWLEALLRLPMPPSPDPAGVDTLERTRVLAHARTWIYLHAAGYAWNQDEVERAVELWDSARESAQAIGDAHEAMLAFKGLGSTAFATGEVERGKAYYQEGLALARQSGDTSALAALLNSLCFRLLPDSAEWEQAAAMAEEALTAARLAGNAYEEVYAQLNLGRIAIRRGDPAGGCGHAIEALRFARQCGLMVWIPECLELLAMAAGQVGDRERAARLFGAASEMDQQAGIVRSQSEQIAHEAYAAPPRADLGEDAWQAAFAAGRALSLEEAISEALAETR